MATEVWFGLTRDEILTLEPDEIFARKADAVFQHVYESYYGAGKSVYAAVA